MIKLENVTKKYGSFTAVDNISFEIHEGEIVGLLGPNGAGKSTTMNMITGYIEPTSGKIFVNGWDLAKNPKKAKASIGYMPENVPLYKDLTVKEFVTYMAELKLVPKKEVKTQVLHIMEQTGLSEVQNKLIRNLSRGYKQRVGIAGALVSSPKILILDEPTVGLDPKQITEIRSLIKSLQKNYTVILSSHILSEISQICEKVIIINKGKMIAQDTPSNLEETVKGDNSILVLVEDFENKMEQVHKKIPQIKEIKLIRNNSDGTKQYIISSKDNSDIRKIIFEQFAKEGITIFEMKKSEITLEDAFIKLIGKDISSPKEEQHIEASCTPNVPKKNKKKGGKK